jgi:hypothetical protein
LAITNQEIIVMLSFFARLGQAVLLAVVATLVACGGGEEPFPTVEFQGFTALGGAKVRLTFSATEGFSQPVAVGDQVVWHSGMISGTQPTAPRAKVQQAVDGSLYADVTLNHTNDRGLFGIAQAGATLALLNGQPVNHMVVGRWQLPTTMKSVSLNDGTGRVWIDVNF